MDKLPSRKKLPHNIPMWARSDAVWFVSINALPRGSNHLCHSGIADKIWESVRFNADRGLWWPHLFLLMPDHLHGLFGFRQETGLQKIVSDWKHFVSHALHITWQRDFFDHRLRKDESFDEKAHYIRQNPVRKGLVSSAYQWSYVWTMGSEQAAAGGATALPGRDSAPPLSGI